MYSYIHIYFIFMIYMPFIFYLVLKYIVLFFQSFSVLFNQHASFQTQFHYIHDHSSLDISYKVQALIVTHNHMTNYALLPGKYTCYNQ